MNFAGLAGWNNHWLMLPTDTWASPPRVNVLGVGISAISLQSAVLHCEQLLRSGSKGYVCVTGVHGIMEAQRDASLREILNRSWLCTPDGMPTVWVGRLQGHRKMGRVYGPDFMMAMCCASVPAGYRHFLYGGNPGVAEKLKDRLEEQVPGIRIVGTYTPPFRPLNAVEQEELIAVIKDSKPDIIWVGLSTPKQEIFMAQMIARLGTGLMAGVGAAFDVHAGLLKDAPNWMKNCGLQWLHRLGMEPRRLWRRYLVNTPQFLWWIALS